MRFLLPLATCLLAPALHAAQLSVTAVGFAPLVERKMQRDYGADQTAVLRAAIVAALAKASAHDGLPAGLSVTVTVRDAAPTRPTAKQRADDPALDVVHTRYLGGADLTAEVRDASQRVLTTASYRHFAPDLRWGAMAYAPWADAQLAIDQFALRLAAACRSLPKG